MTSTADQGKQRPRASRWGGWLTAAAVLLVSALPADAARVQISVREVQEQDDTTVAEALVPALPQDVYRLLTKVEAWPTVFTDVAWAKRIQGGDADAVVQLRSHILQNTMTIRFHNQPPEMLSFTLVEGPPGVASSGTSSLRAREEGGQTRVQVSFTLAVRGVRSPPGTSMIIKQLRAAKLRRDMRDLVRWFEKHPADPSAQ